MPTNIFECVIQWDTLVCSIHFNKYVMIDNYSLTVVNSGVVTS